MVIAMATEAREVMTIEQVAEYLQIEPEDVRRLIDTRVFVPSKSPGR